MSRSYKKDPVTTNHHNKINKFKRLANKKIRKAEDVPSGKAYRKLYDSTNIKYFTSRNTLESLLKAYETNEQLQKQFPTEENLRAYWKLHYIRK